MIVGDSPQALVVKLSLNDAEKLIANRGAAGFNALWINLLCNDSTGGFWDGKRSMAFFHSDALFDLSIPDVSTPNEPYFRRVDAILKAAARQGITVFLNPIETLGWTKALLEPSCYGLRLGSTSADATQSIQTSSGCTGTTSVDGMTRAPTRLLWRWREGSERKTRRIFTRSSLLSGQRLVRRCPLAFPRRCQCRVYLLPDVRPGTQGIQSRTARSDFHGRGKLRVRTSLEGTGNTSQAGLWAMLSGASGQLYGNKYTWQFVLPAGSVISTPEGWPS